MPHNPKVTELRQEGKLQEALELAQDGLNNNPGDIKNKRDMGWVLYTLIKKFFNENDVVNAKDYLDSFDRLRIPEDDTKIHVNINKYRQFIDPEKLIILEAKKESFEGNHKKALKLYREAHLKFPDDKDVNEGLGWELEKEIKIYTNDKFTIADLDKIRLLLNEFLKLNIDKPSKLYSLILWRVIKISESYDKFPYFVKEWGLENLKKDEVQF